MAKQRTKSDCGIAAVANAVGISYKKAKEAFGKVDRGGMLPHEIDFLLWEFGKWKRLRPNGKNINDWVAQHQHGRYVLSLDCLFNWHAVAIVDGEIIGGYANLDMVVEAWELLERH